jgi:transcription antitermination protein NusB
MSDNEDILCDELPQSDQRSVIFHLLYAAEAFDYQVSLESIADNFGKGYGIIIPEESPVFQEARAIIEQREKLDAVIMPLLDNWRFERLGVCTRLILRIGVWELLQAKHDPLVIINEAIELAKCFAEKDSFKFVNGILDELIKHDKDKASLTLSDN